jgi:heavy metal translocating P-type ATPase
VVEDERTPPGATPGREALFLAVTAAGLAGGIVALLAGADRAADLMWAGTAVLAAALSAAAIGAALRQGRVGVDLIALLALVGAVVVGEQAAGAVIAVMVATGRALEERAITHARRDLSALLGRTPTVAHRRAADGTVDDVELGAIAVGDVVVVKPGETVPVDGRVHTTAVLDESALTGEPVPVDVPPGGVAASGAINAGGLFEMRAVASAEDSTYAGILRLVEQAGPESAPSVRLADRYALAFVPLTLLLAGGAWAVSGDAVRAVAVLVVATPCPLVLAVPIAVVSGVARAARVGVIVKGGAVLEALGTARTLVFDKTGTVTSGRPVVTDVETGGDVAAAEVLCAAASVEQASPHVLASSIVAAASGEDRALAWPDDATEVVGQGLAGRVGRSEVRVGRLEWIEPGAPPPWAQRVKRRAFTDGAMTVFVEIDGDLAGALVLEDPVRVDAARTLRGLRQAGFDRLVMATGDRAAVADAVGLAVGADEVVAECRPEDKAARVRAEATRARTVMVGDGINDAPALAAADVGVALGARGSTASAETASVVVAVDRIDRLADGVRIAHRSREVARQSVLLGMGLSLVAMVAAALGYLPPLPGALVQEAIDVVAIANALRALTPGRHAVRRLAGNDADLTVRLHREHSELDAGLREMRDLADVLADLPHDEALARLAATRAFLEGPVLDHEREEDTVLYPAVDEVLGGDAPTAAMARGHAEIERYVALFGRLVDDVGAGGLTRADVRGLQRVLDGLHAIVRLHMAQEEQEYFSLADIDGTTTGDGGR